MEYSYELVSKIADWLLARTHIRPHVGIICGTGMSGVAEALENCTGFSYEDIPHFPNSTVDGHAGRLLFGTLNGVQVVCMQGRFHFYEGYQLSKCAMPVRVMKLCGVTHVVMSNAAGGINHDYKEGDIMVMRDHINFMGFAGNNPLVGPNDERWGPRFIAANKVYDRGLRKEAMRIAKEIGMEPIIREGVYVFIGGPSFETIAEINMFRICGADAVGMSTVSEALMAHHAGLKVFAFSLITNKCVSDYDDDREANHDEVIDVGAKRADILKKWIGEIVKTIPKKGAINGY